MNTRRVVITGLGVVSPLGIGAESFWQALLEGRHGFAPLRAFDPAPFRQPNAAEVDTGLLTAALAREGIPPAERAVDMGLVAAAEALRQAGVDGADPRPWASVFGSALGCAHGLASVQEGYREHGLRGVRPTAIPRFMHNALSANVSIRFRLTGPNFTIASACASSSAAIGAAFRLVRSGAAAGAVAGGSDSIFVPWMVAAWNNLGILSRRQDPGLCCRPFDRERDGTALGEGAAALALENRDQAMARGAPILAEILGYGENSDAVHIANPDAESQAGAIRSALRDAGLEPGDLGFINAHGTAAPISDIKEAEAIRRALGSAADDVPVGSLKSYFGHTQGACGALETAAAVLTAARGIMPGNRNLVEPDPACPVRLAGREPLEIRRPAGLKTSFGFGGHNTVLVLGGAR